MNIENGVITCSAVFTVQYFLSKCWFLASYRIGWLMLLSNAVYETIEKWPGVSRVWQDCLLLVLATLGFGWSMGPWVGTMFALAGGAAWAGTLLVDMRWRADVPAEQHRDMPRVPFPVPRLVVSLRGPVLKRGPRQYALGCWPVGMQQDFELLVLNPGSVRPQLPLKVDVTSGSSATSVHVVGLDRGRCPEPGEVVRVRIRVSAREVSAGTGMTVRVEHGDWKWQRTLSMEAVVEPDVSVVGACVTRWKHGAGGAFNWRGDHDLQDPATFQSVEGLRRALGLAVRFRMPTSIMLSARLTLDKEAHEAFCRHHGWDRHNEEIPAFIDFLRDEVDIRPEQDFPVETDRAFSGEVGNHCYLHYGTHAAADPGNDWRSHARMGQGRYSWMKGDRGDSFAEQRDNVLEGSTVIEQHLGVRPVSFTIPSDVRDPDTPCAVEAAGIEVATETDATKLQKLLFFPLQHHPRGCERLVELTRVLPRDPVNGAQIAMLKFWVGHARRTGRAMVFLAHHHLLMYQGNVCYSLTAELLRHVLADTEGDVWCGTLTAIGRYWRDVLSERTRCVEVQVEDGKVVVRNHGGRDLPGLPLELELTGGGHVMRLVSVPARAVLVLEGPEWTGCVTKLAAEAA